MPSLAPDTCRWLVIALLVGMTWVGLAHPAHGGSYRDSAHGDPVNGVYAALIDPKYAEYSAGNCTHCHQMHASIEGAEPAPVDGPAPHVLFSKNFIVTRTLNPYLETDDFCFRTTAITGSRLCRIIVRRSAGPPLGTGPGSILAAFNRRPTITFAISGTIFDKRLTLVW
jgi:hypothetical protein